MTQFKDFQLDKRLEKAVQEVGFVEPTPIQKQAIPVALKGGDVLGLAQTGTGKTAAFALPILQRLTRGPLRRVRALVVAPTRELAEQIHETFVALGQNTKVRSTTVYGGVGKQRQIDALKTGPEVVVACPGRLLDLAGTRHIDLSKVEVLVLDEADRMCDMGFLPDIRRILKLVPNRDQTLFFSATMPDDIRQLSSEILNRPTTVQIGITAPAKTVSHAIYPINQNKKKKLLLAILDRTPTGKVLVFTRTKRRARFLANDLAKAGYNAIALQGNMSQNRRTEAINGFRGRKYDILVATDIAARGIDVSEITHVFNFDMPDTVDAYTHRIGRTGRAAATGEAYTFVTSDDKAMIRDIEKTLKQSLERRQLSDFDYGEFEIEKALKPDPFRPNSKQRSPHKPQKQPGKRPQRRRSQHRSRRTK